MAVAFERILIPLDGSPLSEKALPHAVALAEKFDSELILLRAADLYTPLLATGDPEAAYWIAEAREEARQEAANYLEAQRETLRQAGYNVDILLCEGSPAEEIIEAAAKEAIDLIVMSTHGRGGVARWTFGSVADKVARYSCCPVLLIRQTEEPPSESSGADVVQ